jgi:hypothetical protein
MGSWKYGLIAFEDRICVAEIYWLKHSKKPSTFCLVTIDEMEKSNYAMMVMDLEAQYRYAKIFKYPQDFMNKNGVSKK